MNKTNNNKIIFSLKVLSVLAFSLLIIPAKAFATAGYVDNPTPYIASINPNSSNSNIGSITVTITGNGFIPSSIARMNGSDRPTTFIDSSHLLINLNSNDLKNTNGVYINVFNGFPGGGYSNSELFTVNKVTPVVNTNTNSTYVNTNQTQNTTNTNANSSSDNNLAAAAIFGSDGFLPSGLIQWIMLAIIILIIIILVRRVSGAEAKYNQAPMKTP